MKHGIIRKKGFWTAFTLPLGLLVVFGFTQESKIPWAVDGYQKVSEFHLKYWSLTKETFEDFQNIKEGNTKSEVSELWFSQNPPRIRDKYVEEGFIQCNQFKGREWEKAEHDGKTYILKERIIQMDSRRTTYYIQNISSGGGVELCEYKKDESTANIPSSLRDALYLLTTIPYYIEPESLELTVANLEMEELFNPDKYKKTIAELKKRHEIIGRPTAKWETGHGLILIPAQGFAYMDLEWGFALEGYLTGLRGGGVTQPVTLEKPVCIYKALAVATQISDTEVFKKWMD
jgi:hypothetical protein